MPLALDAKVEKQIRAAFDDASRELAAELSTHGSERTMTGALVTILNRRARDHGLDIQVRDFPEAVENENGADLGITVSGPSDSGGRTIKGFIAQAKRDDGPKRLSNGVGELKAPRGDSGRSQLERLRDHNGGAVIIYGPNGVRGVPATALDETPGTKDVREAARRLSEVVGELMACRLGVEGEKSVDSLMGSQPSSAQGPNVAYRVDVHVNGRPSR